MNDVKTKPTIEATKLFADLDKPSLHALSYALRHPDTWPEGFVWSYQNCRHCAMGLAHVLWEKSIPEVGTKNGPSVMAKKFAMSYEAATAIFLGRTSDENASWVPKKSKQEVSTVRTGFLGLFREGVVITTIRGNHDAVTPEMVADQIDKYLATCE
jgi:hypothetical protein